jgi:hypothetical protein
MNQFIELGASLASDKPIRNVIKPQSVEVIEEWKKEHNNTDVFTSVFYYNKEEIRKGKQSGPLYFDLDGEYGLDDLRVLIEFLVQQGCPGESVHIYYSGNKGFHLEIPFDALGIDPVLELNRSFELIAKEIKGIIHASSIDTGIYDAVRLWRLPNSINPKSGLYKIPLAFEELQLSLGQIRELAKNSRLDFRHPEVMQWEKFADVFQKAKKRIRNVNLKGGVLEPVAEGQRNDATFKRAIRFKAEGKLFEEAVELCSKIQDKPPLPIKEIRRTVASAYQDKYEVKQFTKNKKNSADDSQTTSLVVTKDGIICEEIFDPKLGEPLFAIYDGKSVEYKPSIESNGKIYKPIAGEIITSGLVKLPSEANEYSSDIELFEEIKRFIHTYVDVSDDWEIWAAYYVLLSWIYDKLPVCPYLCALGASSTGKTRFIQTVGSVCYKPFTASGSVTASPVFRILDRFRGTLIVNEFDHIGEYNNEIIVIFNNGFEADFPVTRTEGDEKKEVRVFQVYGPKLFAARKRKSDWAFESRLLTIPMKETRRKDIPPFLLDDFHNKALELRNKLLMFRFRHYAEESIIHTELFPNIRGRLRQTLLSITSVIHDEVFLQKAQEFATELEKSLKNIKGFDLDTFVYQVLIEQWEQGEVMPQIKEIAKKVKELADLDKLSSKAVGNIVRDELGFETKRGGSSGNYVVLLSSEQLNSLKDRYEIVDTPNKPELTSETSASSEAGEPVTEVTEQAELTTKESQGDLFTSQERLVRIRELFFEIKEKYNQHSKYPKNQDLKDKLFDECKPIFDELETLGVERTFSSTLFFFGPEIDDKLVGQFRDST